MNAHAATLPFPSYPLSRRFRHRLLAPVSAPRLSIVVVNYHQWADTAALVAQLRLSQALRRGRAEVMVVDNHSPPDRAAVRLRRLEGVSLRRWRHNRGFARAVNEGCRLSRGDWFLLLNPDVTLGPGFVEEAMALIARLESQETNTGIVGLGLRNSDGTQQLSSGPLPSLWGTLTRLLLPRGRRKYSATPQDQPSQVDWVTGCGLLVRRSCWEQLGGFDPSFFLYYEDVDLCRRARELGWEVRHEPGLTLVHHHPLHTRTVPPALRLVTRHALLTYGSKHWPRWQFRALAWVVRLEAWWRRWRARWRGDAGAESAFATLDGIASDLLQGRPAAAGRRLLREVRRREEGCVALSVGSDPQS